ncbi:hypothetical protein D1007_15275 [Hordeum vulgare]|nr:hypothetical protein D1007_15275 [Hordeum vulgare]
MAELLFAPAMAGLVHLPEVLDRPRRRGRRPPRPRPPPRRPRARARSPPRAHRGRRRRARGHRGDPRRVLLPARRPRPLQVRHPGDSGGGQRAGDEERQQQQRRRRQREAEAGGGGGGLPLHPAGAPRVAAVVRAQVPAAGGRGRGRRGRALRERRAHRHRQEAAAAREEGQVRPGRHRLICTSVAPAFGTSSAFVISDQCSSSR